MECHQKCGYHSGKWHQEYYRDSLEWYQEHGKTGAYTGVGVFTIVEVREGKGSDAGWGKLKSGAGWISLDYCKSV